MRQVPGRRRPLRRGRRQPPRASARPIAVLPPPRDRPLGAPAPRVVVVAGSPPGRPPRAPAGVKTFSPPHKSPGTCAVRAASKAAAAPERRALKTDAVGVAGGSGRSAGQGLRLTWFYATDQLPGAPGRTRRRRPPSACLGRVLPSFPRSDRDQSVSAGTAPVSAPQRSSTTCAVTQNVFRPGLPRPDRWRCTSGSCPTATGPPCATAARHGRSTGRRCRWTCRRSSSASAPGC